jgi:hypothetical protein
LFRREPSVTVVPAALAVLVAAAAEAEPEE